MGRSARQAKETEPFAFSARQANLFRLVVMAVGTVVTPFSLLSAWTSGPALLATLLAGWIFTLASLFRPGSWVSRLPLVAATGDGLLTLALIGSTGGHRSPFVGLLFMVGFSAAMRLKPGRAFALNLALVLGFLALVFSSGVRGTALLTAALRTAVMGTGAVFAAGLSHLSIQEAARRRKQVAREQLLLLVDESPDAIIGITQRGEIAAWSLGAERMTGFRAEEVVGKSLLSLFEAPLQKDLDRFMRLAGSGVLKREPWTQKAVTKAGQQLVLSVTASRLLDPLAQGLISIVARDVTTRHQMQQRLERSQRILAQAQRDARLGSYEWNARTDASAWTDEMFRLIGKDPQTDRAGWALFFSVLSAEDGARLAAQAQRLRATGGDFEENHRVLLADGTVRWVRHRGQVLKDPETGRYEIFRGTAQDITELHQAMEAKVKLAEAQIARAAAEEALHARDEFISIASHELKTPITSLKLLVQAALRSGLPEDNAIRERFLKVDRQAARLTDLVENLLDVSRVSAGRLTLAPERTDFAAQVRGSLERFAEEAARRGSELRLDLPASVPGYWDPLRLGQIIDNLVSNALKYGEGRQIDISLTAERGLARLTVRDRGISIKPEDQARIFERFERAVSVRKFGGLGLGLWVVRELVTKMGGEITVRSSPGEGSTFRVTLPVEPTVSEEQEREAPLHH